MYRRWRGSDWLFGLATLALTACGLGRIGATPTAGLAITPPTVAPTVDTVPVQNPTATSCKPWPAPSGLTVDHVPGRPLPVVVAASTVIVVGTAEPAAEIVNLAQVEMFALGQVYAFTVQRYLKGTGPGTLKIVQIEGEIHWPAACVTTADIAKAKTLYVNDYVPLRAGTNYLLLLQPVTWPQERAGYFIGTDRRWRWRLNGDGTGVLEVIGYTFPAEPTPTWSDTLPIVSQIETLLNNSRP